MPKARTFDRRRKSIRNIRKITRTMELIATARFKKAMDRAAAATAYTRRITQIVADLAQAGLEVTHPLLQRREETRNAILLMLTSNRGLCGGYNSSVIRLATRRLDELRGEVLEVRVDVAGKRGISAMRFRNVEIHQRFTQFEDRPQFDQIEPIADRYLDAYVRGNLDRLDVAYTQFLSASRQTAVVQTLLPLGLMDGQQEAKQAERPAALAQRRYEFLPSAESILEEIVPTSFKVRLFKCFLDAAVSEQIARMVAMKLATDNANEMIKRLSMKYNRARQSQITSEISEIIGGAEALNV